MLSKEVAERLVLAPQIPSLEMIERSGNLATRSVRWGDPYGERQELIYLREDLLKKFLKDSGMSLVWAIWGERELIFDNSHFRPLKRPKFKTYENFKRIYKYSNRIAVLA